MIEWYTIKDLYNETYILVSIIQSFFSLSRMQGRFLINNP